jgi:tetratricopeptide (TPR) repeat protein
MELIRQHPLANEQGRILAFSIELALHPSERAALLDAAVQNYRKAEPAARCAFGMWLHLHKEYERMLVLIPIEEGFKRQDLLRVCLEALTGLGRFSEIQRILETKDVPLDLAFKELYLARTAEELGSATEAELHWRRAHLAAGPSSAQMKEIASYAEKFGRLDQAEIALRSLSANASTARIAMEGLMRIAQRRGDLPMLHDTLKKMRERWPQDDSVKNDLAYVSLLMGRAVDESLAVAKQLVARSPKSLPHRTTLALAAIRKNDAAGAISVYHGLQIPRCDGRNCVPRNANWSSSGGRSERLG